MDPRIILKTHVGCLRPGHYSVLIAKCTSPNEPAYPEIVMQRLETTFGLPKSVAKFVVLLSTDKNRGLGFLLDSMLWSWKGRVIHTVLDYLGKTESDQPQTFYDLQSIERILYFKYLMESDGAVILELAKTANESGELQLKDLRAGIQRIFKEIFEAYLNIATDLKSKVAIRDTLAKIHKPYDQGTLGHKLMPHVEALADLGLLNITGEKGGTSVSLRATDDGTFSLTPVASLKDVAGLEGAIISGNLWGLIADVYGLAKVPYSSLGHSKLLRECILFGYEKMKSGATKLADIRSITDWVCAKLLAVDGVLVPPLTVMSTLNNAKRSGSSGVSFHLDGRGGIAYVSIQGQL